MVKVKFHKLNSIENSRLIYAVIVTRYKGKWVFVKHKNRETWEIPGGHREANEDINHAASRELVEETGAKDFKIYPVSIYSVLNDGTRSFGQLFYAEVKKFNKLPDFEIGEIKLFNSIPENLTYPLIQPQLFREVINTIEKN